MKTSLKAVAALLLCLVSVPTTVPAQSTQADSLRNLVETLLTDFMFAEGKPTLRLASLPSNMPELRLPPGTRVVGSLEYPKMSMSLLRSDNSADLVRQVRASLESNGWSYKAPETTAGFSLDGASISARLCADSAFIIVGPSRDQHVFVLHSTDPMTRGNCREPPARDADGRPRSPLPRLNPPAGAGSVGWGSTGGGDSWSYRNRLNSDLPLSQISDHYVKEISLAGGETGASNAMASAITVPLTLKDTQGVMWRGMMVVIATSPGTRSVYIELSQ